MSVSGALPQASAEEGIAVSSSIGFSIERSLLLKALTHVQSVVERRNTIAILSNVKIELAEGTLRLTATDMDIAMSETVPADVTQEGALTVPAHTFYDIIRKLPDGAQVQLTGQAQGDGKLTIKSGSCEFTLSCLPAADFPVLEQDEYSHQFTLNVSEVIGLVDKTRFAISTEETRYYLNGIYLHALEEGATSTLCAVATDGHRLAKIDVTLPEGASGMPGVIVPRKTVAELRKLVDEAEETVSISLSQTKIRFVCGNAILTSKLIDGSFPDYTKVIPSSNDKILEVSTAGFSQAVDRVSTISSDKTRAIKLVVEKGRLILSATNEENGSANEALEASYDSDSIDIGFNSRYVLEMLSCFEGDSVQFTFSDGGAPALVKDPANVSAVYVIMPMRI
jgi:DNA polymerase-3 subunit beta